MVLQNAIPAALTFLHRRVLDWVNTQPLFRPVVALGTCPTRRLVDKLPAHLRDCELVTMSRDKLSQGG